MFSYVFFYLYGHGKLDLKFVDGRAENVDWRQEDLSKKAYTSEAETPRKIIELRVLEKKGSFSYRHICLDKQLLPQINICCREVMQNNKMASSRGQPFLDACSILEKRLPGSRVGFQF